MIFICKIFYNPKTSCFKLSNIKINIFDGFHLFSDFLQIFIFTEILNLNLEISSHQIKHFFSHVKKFLE